MIHLRRKIWRLLPRCVSSAVTHCVPPFYGVVIILLFTCLTFICLFTLLINVNALDAVDFGLLPKQESFSISNTRKHRNYNDDFTVFLDTSIIATVVVADPKQPFKISKDLFCQIAFIWKIKPPQVRSLGMLFGIHKIINSGLIFVPNLIFCSSLWFVWCGVIENWYDFEKVNVGGKKNQVVLRTKRESKKIE